MVDDAVKRVFSLSRQDIYFIVIILMLAVKWPLTLAFSNPSETFRKPYGGTGTPDRAVA